LTGPQPIAKKIGEVQKRKIGKIGVSPAFRPAALRNHENRPPGNERINTVAAYFQSSSFLETSLGEK
jgi:hypothetical protein